MSGKSRNGTIRVIAEFSDEAIPFGEQPVIPASGAPANGGREEGSRAPSHSTAPEQPLTRPQDGPGTPKSSPTTDGNQPIP